MTSSRRQYLYYTEPWVRDQSLVTSSNACPALLILLKLRGVSEDQSMDALMYNEGLDIDMLVWSYVRSRIFNNSLYKHHHFIARDLESFIWENGMDTYVQPCFSVGDCSYIP